MLQIFYPIVIAKVSLNYFIKDLKYYKVLAEKTAYFTLFNNSF